MFVHMHMYVDYYKRIFKIIIILYANNWNQIDYIVKFATVNSFIGNYFDDT